MKSFSSAGTCRRITSIQSCEASRARSRSVSAGVWLTTLSSCLCDQTSVGSGATFRSPTTIMRFFALARMPPNHALIASRKSSLWRNFSLSAGSGISPPAGT